MTNQNLNIGIKTVWLLVIGNPLLIMVGVLAKIQNWDYSQIILLLGLMLLFSTCIIIISDMLINKIFNKTFWVLSLFIFPCIAPLFYLIKRNKLITYRK